MADSNAESMIVSAPVFGFVGKKVSLLALALKKGNKSFNEYCKQSLSDVVYFWYFVSFTYPFTIS